MKDDPLRLQLRKELRELRKDAGLQSLDRIAGCEALIRVVGMGSVEQAKATILEMLARHAGEPDSSIRAYLETSGVGLAGASLNERLTAYAAAHYVDPRTALRRSDRGADAVATLFRDEELFFRPWGHLTMFQTGRRVFATVALHIAPGAEYRHPRVWVNDEIVEGLEFAFETATDAAGYVRALEHIDQFELRDDTPWLFKVDVEWRMPVWPQWVLGSQIADPRLATKLQTQRNFMTEVTLTWGATDKRAGLHA